ncbi:hypothetical protein ZWY2020_038425 [Hordeum vulgare]|nr:hypothetical protein ZWY2020_038425 [Hordeum vulgare]
MDLRVRRSPASVVAVEGMLRLAEQCVMPAMQTVIHARVTRSGTARTSTGAIHSPQTEGEQGILPILKRIRAVFDKVGIKEEESVVVRITSCPNGCARPYMAEVRFVVTAQTVIS